VLAVVPALQIQVLGLTVVKSEPVTQVTHSAELLAEQVAQRPEHPPQFPVALLRKKPVLQTQVLLVTLVSDLAAFGLQLLHWLAAFPPQVAHVL
jgi:hypothetical protein